MKLTFEKLTEQHASGLLEIWSDSEVTKYTYVRNIKSIDDAKNKISRYLKYQHGLIGPFVVIVDNKIIGLAAGMSTEEKPEESEIFFHFEKKSWRKGYGSKTIDFLLNKGFNSLKLQRIHAQAVTENNASWKLLEKKGFSERKTLKNAFQNERDLYSYSITEEEYRKNNISLD
jgi:ribosomal-protein-alanine N-acetyltransferase